MWILKTRHGMVLATWALLNILSGIFIFFTENQLYYFLAMNASWGFINLGVAAFIYFHHNSIFKEPLSLLKLMDNQRHAEKVIFFNIGLDIAFVVSGLALFFYGNGFRIIYPELWKGFGYSVMIQGAFLLVLDIIFYNLHIQNRQKIYPVWQHLMRKLEDRKIKLSDSNSVDKVNE